MIYNNNRAQSLGEVEIPTNESFLGFGSINFIQECYADELSLFEAAIESDMDEAIAEEVIDAEYTEKDGKETSKKSTKELASEFVKQAKEKLAKMMEKFIQWIDGMIKSAIKKFDEVVGKENAKFCATAEKKFNKADKASLKKPKKHFKSEAASSKYTEELLDMMSKSSSIAKSGTQADLDSINKSLEALKAKTVAKFVEENSEATAENANVEEIFKTHIEILKGSRKSIMELRTKLGEAKGTAKTIYKEAKSNAKIAENKEEANIKVQTASAYQSLCKNVSSLIMSIVNQEAKLARSVINQILSGSKAVKEDVELDTEFLIGLGESIDFLSEQAMEEMSVAEECDHDSDIADFEDDEED